MGDFMERLDKVLANMGVGTRKEVKQLIKKGEVSVRGMVAQRADLKIDPEADELWVGGKKIVYKKHIYLMLNKPEGVISATFDPRHRTVCDLVPEEFAHFKPFPVGRLDIDTRGLLILTNDGKLAHELLSPKKHVPKTYFAKLDKEVCKEDIDAFEKGIVLDDGYKTLPARLEEGEGGVYVTIYEGKFHQVKRMFNQVGKNVTYLKRIKMGNLTLDPALSKGEVRELTKEELDCLWTL